MHVSIVVKHACEKMIVSAVLEFNQGFHAILNYNQLHFFILRSSLFAEVNLIKNNIFVYCDFELNNRSRKLD